MMSWLSKFAMSSPTWLYHHVIKTEIESDGNSPSAPLSNLSLMNNMPGMGISTQNSQILGCNANPQLNRNDCCSSQMPVLNAVGLNILPHGVPMGPDLMSHSPMMGHVFLEPWMVSQGQMHFPKVSIRYGWASSTAGSILYHGLSGGRATSQDTWMSQEKAGLAIQHLPQNSADVEFCKPGELRGPDSCAMRGNGTSYVFMDPDLREVISELDLSSITPSQKPNQILKWFP